MARNKNKPKSIECRICGKVSKPSLEHVIPRAAGGGATVKVYNGTELLKTLSDKKEVPYGTIKQSGISSYTLCKECNEKSGLCYDEPFAIFYNVINYCIPEAIKNDKTIPQGDPEKFLADKSYTFGIKRMKPFNIAKRVLVSFCSVEHPGLTNAIPEIRKAILDEHYKPNTQDFSIYLCLHLGNSNYYGTIATLVEKDKKYFVHSYAGIESHLVAFYLTRHEKEHSNGPNNCLDITYWLTDFDYDQEVTMNFVLPFNKSMTLQFPLPNDGR